MAEQLKILIADDSPTQAALLKKRLREKGYEVVVARDGYEALKAAYQESPDLLVSDIVMPKFNGYQICRLLKNDATMSWMPIILLTSLETRADMFWGIKSGANIYLTKRGDVGGMVEDIQQFILSYKLVPKPREQGPGGAGGVVLSDDVFNQRLAGVLDETLFESTVITEIGDLVNKITDYKKIVFSTAECLSKVIDFDLAVGCLLGGDAREYYVYINGLVQERFIAAARESVDITLLNDSRTPKLPPEFKVESFQSSHQKVGEEPAAAFLSEHVGLLYTGEAITGAIGLFSRKANVFGPKTVRAFGLISKQANIVINYARLYEYNRELSITDGLTKVYNHRYFQEQLKRDFSQSARHKSHLSLIILDIDHFKGFNDTYGHQQGDVVLHDIAHLLKKSVRNDDVVSRYGGEEFTILMPNSGPADSLRIAERLRKSIEQLEIPGREEPLRVTVSMGVATVPHPLICNPAQLVNAADQALYLAKKNGRNRVEQATG